jgi:anti-sigma regulatory factor (Ser/Thr protein kinase)
MHVALLCPDEKALTDTVALAVDDGLRAGDAVLVALYGAYLDGVRDAVTPGSTVSWVDLASTGRSPGYLLPGIMHTFSTRQPERRLRMIGSPWRPDRSAMEYPACMQHEAAVNAVFADNRAIVLCPYHLNGAAEDVGHDVARTHRYVTRDGVTTMSTTYAEDQQSVFADFNMPLPQPPPTATTLLVRRDSLTAARAATTQAALDAGLAPSRVTDAVVAINELATNMVQHGGGTGQMWLWADAGTLICHLSDSGVFHNWLAGRVPPRPSDITGGRGLIMVHQLCDLVRIHTGATGTQVRVHVSG